MRNLKFVFLLSLTHLLSVVVFKISIRNEKLAKSNWFKGTVASKKINNSNNILFPTFRASIRNSRTAVFSWKISFANEVCQLGLRGKNGLKYEDPTSRDKKALSAYFGN